MQLTQRWRTEVKVLLLPWRADRSVRLLSNCTLTSGKNPVTWRHTRTRTRIWKNFIPLFRVLYKLYSETQKLRLVFAVFDFLFCAFVCICFWTVISRLSSTCSQYSLLNVVFDGNRVLSIPNLLRTIFLEVFFFPISPVHKDFVRLSVSSIFTFFLVFSFNCFITFIWAKSRIINCDAFRFFSVFAVICSFNFTHLLNSYSFFREYILCFHIFGNVTWDPSFCVLTFAFDVFASLLHINF